MDTLPQKGQVATEFRALAGSISEEVFSSMFPSISRVLSEYRENSENNHSETTSGIRTIETTSGLLDSNIGDLNFQLEILKTYQGRSLNLLENLKDKIDSAGGSSSIFDDLMGNIFGGRGAKKTPAGKKGTTPKGAGKGTAKEGATKVDKNGKPVTSGKPKYSVKIFSGLNLLAAGFAIYDALSRVMALDPADPDWNKKATEEVSAVVARFGASVVGAIAGSILGSAVFPGIGTIAGLIGGLALGYYTDKFLGDQVEEVTKNVVDKLWEMANKKKESKIPTTSKLASLGAPTDNVFTNKTDTTLPQKAQMINAGTSMIVPSEEDNVTVAKDIMFGARKMKFVGDKILFTNMTMGGTDKKGKPIKFQTRRQNKTSQKVEELQEKAGEISLSSGAGGTTPASGGGGTTPNSPITGSSGGGTGPSGYNPSGSGVNVTGSAQEAMQFFISKGWSPEQAAGIVGNLMTESNLKTGAVGDGGKAYGIAQWHPDRQAKFQEVYGKSIRQSSFQEQLEFVNWELNNSNKKAGDILRNAKDAATAAELVDIHYERSKGLHRYQRMNNAVGLMKNQQQQQPTANLPTSSNVGPGASIAPTIMPMSQQTASLVGATPRTDGSSLMKTSAEVVSAPVEDPQEVKEKLQKVVSINKQYSGPGNYSESISVESEGEDVSARIRLVQHFSHA